MGVSTKNLVVNVFICLVLLCLPVFSETADYSKLKANSALQCEFSDYMANLRAKIQRNWTPPDYVQNGNTLVLFKITRWGKIVSSEIIESSNSDVFDESTLEALRKSEPFDKFPPSSTRDTLTIKYNFHANIVDVNNMKKYVAESDKYFNVDNQKALEYINLAIKEVEGDISSYFLYHKRSKIKEALGDNKGAEEDLAYSRDLKMKFDRKRINSCKLIAEMDHSAFSYFYLAHAYELAGDYKNAITAIDEAINLTELNNQYKRYRQELVQKSTQ